LVSGGKVTAKVILQAKGKKIDVIKFKRRQNYRRTHGHRHSVYADREEAQ
jgi:large subunit ribosomal protein L21